MQKEKIGFFNRFLNSIEVIGNKLPNPVSIFFILAATIMIVSFFMAQSGVSVVGVDSEKVTVVNLLSIEQLQIILANVVKSFQGFAPLGLVLVVMIGAGLAEKTKFMETAMKLAVLKVPKSLLTGMIFFVGIVANAAGDAGFIILPPLAAILFLSAGRHPLIGIFAAFAGVAAGFSANIIVSMIDVLLSGFTNMAIDTLKDTNFAPISPAANLYFLIVSTVVLTVAGTIITEKIVAPRFANEDISQFQDKDSQDNGVNPIQVKAIKAALLSILIYGIIIILLCVIPLGKEGIPFMASKEVIESTKEVRISIMNYSSTFMQGIVPIITLLFFIPGLVYGKITKVIKTDHDVVKMIGESLSEMGPYILLAFAASQFTTLFTQSNLGIIIAVNGAETLKSIGLPGPLMFVLFIIFSAFINLFIGSASAKWAMLAPIFVPMFMLLNYDPAITQMAYRIGDSISNPISPLFPYFPIMLGFVAKYKKDVGIGTIISNMIPYSLVFGVLWILLFVLFMVLNIPLGI